jgi:hypothetical protein
VSSRSDTHEGADATAASRPDEGTALSRVGVEGQTAATSRSFGGLPLRALGERLGFLRAGPRDAVEVHMAALASRAAGASAAKAGAYSEEGRISLLGVMGGLVSHHRRLSLGQGAE